MEKFRSQGGKHLYFSNDNFGDVCIRHMIRSWGSLTEHSKEATTHFTVIVIDNTREKKFKFVSDL